MLEQDEFERRLNLARERGANDLQVEALRKKYQSNVKPRDNALVGFGKAVVKPITDYGKDAIGGLYGAGAAALEIGQRLTVDPQNKSKTFDREIQRGLNFATPRGRAAMTDQSLAPTKQIGLGAQRGAGVASYFVPGGKTVGSAVKLGMVSGALQGASQDNAGIGSVVSGVVGGGIGGGGAKLLTRGLQSAGRVATDTLPKKVMNSVFKEPLKDTRAAVKSGTKTLGEMALEKGEKGLSDEKIYQNAVTRINQFEDELTNKLSSSKRIVPIADIRKTVAPLVKKYQAAGNVADAQAILDRIDGLEAYHGKSMPVSVANEVKRTLYDEARNGYGKTASETIEGIKAIARGFKEAIASKVDGADEINKQLSYNGRIADSLVDRMSREGRNKMFGLTDTIMAAPALVAGPAALLPVAAKKALESTAGATAIANTLNTAGNVVNPMLGKLAQSRVPSYIGSNIGSRTTNALTGGSKVFENNYNTNDYDKSYNAPKSPLVHSQNINPSTQPVNPFREQPMQPAVPQQPIQPRVVMPMDAPSLIAQGVDLKKHWVVSPDGTKIWNPYTQKAMPYNKDVWQPKQKALTEKQRSYMGAAKIGQEMVDLLDTGNVATGPVAGRLDNLASKFGVQDPDQTALRSKIATARTVARNALLGANMSEQELNSYLDAMFDINQPTEILKQKLQTFIQDMNTLSATDTTGSFDLGGME